MTEKQIFRDLREFLTLVEDAGELKTLDGIGWDKEMGAITEMVYREKLGKAESFIASPVAADGKIYVVNDLGLVYIIKAGKEFELIDTIPLNDVCMAVPAITENMIFFRTEKSIIAIGN